MTWREEYDRLFGTQASICGDFHHDDVLRVIQLAIAEEREACAKIADEYLETDISDGTPCGDGVLIAERIRARV